MYVQNQKRLCEKVLIVVMNKEVYPFITRKLQQACENGSTPGVALLVDRNGELVYRYAVGYAQQYPEHKDLDEDTIFDIASLTKVVATTTAVMCLIRDNILSFEEPVQTYMPEFPRDDVTFLHILTHSAGFPGWLPLYEDVQVQLVDMPPLTSNYTESWMFNIIRLADLVLLVVDLSVDSPSDQILGISALLDEHNIKLEREGEGRPQGAIAVKSTLVLGMKNDVQGADKKSATLKADYESDFPCFIGSINNQDDIQELRKKIPHFQFLDSLHKGTFIHLRRNTLSLYQFRFHRRS